MCQTVVGIKPDPSISLFFKYLIFGGFFFNLSQLCDAAQNRVDRAGNSRDLLNVSPLWLPLHMHQQSLCARLLLLPTYVLRQHLEFELVSDPGQISHFQGAQFPEIRIKVSSENQKQKNCVHNLQKTHTSTKNQDQILAGIKERMKLT